jgi:zinc and cadmium transporter
MDNHILLAVYCGLVLLFAMAGGLLPFLGRVTHTRLQFYLSASAGVMLGAAFFHVMPDAFELSGGAFYFGCWMSLGVVGLFCIERFIAPHSHELDGQHHHHHHHHDHNHSHEEAGHEHVGAYDKPVPGEHRAAAPAVAGWMAVLGLTIHTFMNGVGLAGAVWAETAKGSATFLLPGFAMFLAIFLHKPADALAISMVLSRKGVSRGKLFLVQFGFAATVAVGAVAFVLTEKHLAEDIEGPLTGAALAFSAGTFLFVALSDLLPEVQFHRHDRIPLALTLFFGIALMAGIALLEGHEHGHGGEGHSHSHGKTEKDEHHGERDHDHNKDHDHDEDEDHH